MVEIPTKGTPPPWPGMIMPRRGMTAIWEAWPQSPAPRVLARSRAMGRSRRVHQSGKGSTVAPASVAAAARASRRVGFFKAESSPREESQRSAISWFMAWSQEAVSARASSLACSWVKISGALLWRPTRTNWAATPRRSRRPAR